MRAAKGTLIFLRTDNDECPLSAHDYYMRTTDDPNQGDGVAQNSHRNVEMNAGNNIAGYFIGTKVDGFVMEFVPEPATSLAVLSAFIIRHRSRQQPANATRCDV